MSDINAMAAEFEKLNATEEDDVVDVIDDEGDDTPAPDDKAPPGFKSYDQYIADGGDPDMYKGRKAYEAEKKRIDENKLLHSQVRDLKKSTDSIAEAMQEWQQGERDKMRRELEAKLKEQKDSLDIDGALETREQLDKLKVEGRRAPPPHPIIAQFTEDNPIIDPKSDQFNKDFTDDVATIHNARIARMSRSGDGMDVSEAQVIKSLKASFEEAKELNRELFVSSRNDRQGAPTRKPAANGGDKGASLETRLKNMKIDNPRDPDGINANAPFEMYQLIKKRDPKAAERFAKSQLGE